MIDTSNGRARLLDFLPDTRLPAQSLFLLTGDRSKVELDPSAARRSGLEIAVSAAWQTSLQDITCRQCRVLVGQKFGLEWLAAPVADFVCRHPQAECDRYPGDLSVVAILAWREFMRIAPEETRRMLAADFCWLRQSAQEPDWSGSIVNEAAVALDEARRA